MFTRKSPSPGLGLPWGRGPRPDPRSGSSASNAASSMSVVSVPLDDGAIGDGSRISLGLMASGEDCGGGCSKPACSAGLCRQRGAGLAGCFER